MSWLIGVVGAERDANRRSGLPLIELRSPPPKAGVNASLSSLLVTSFDGGKRSSASAFHCCSFPKRHKMKIKDSMHARSSVNHAPVGILVNAEDINTPSRAAKTPKTGNTT